MNTEQKIELMLKGIKTFCDVDILNIDPKLFPSNVKPHSLKQIDFREDGESIIIPFFIQD